MSFLRKIWPMVQIFPKQRISLIRSTRCICSISRKQDVQNYQYNKLHKMLNENRITLCTKTAELDDFTYEAISEETLDGLTEYFEELLENDNNINNPDIIYSSGVLTIALGNAGTYVINKQAPNKQIWLSSPQSGPKRFDFIVECQCWVYKHTGETLHGLLQQEISKVMKNDVDFSKCCYGRLENVTAS